MNSKVKMYTSLYGCYLIYSLSLVSARFAAEHPLFSLASISLYVIGFLLLGIFALIWQQVLKRVPLTMAYANRAITIIYGMVWGALLFAENISWNMLLGAIIIMFGVMLTTVRYE